MKKLPKTYFFKRNKLQFQIKRRADKSGNNTTQRSFETNSWITGGKKGNECSTESDSIRRTKKYMLKIQWFDKKTIKLFNVVNIIFEYDLQLKIYEYFLQICMTS